MKDNIFKHAPKHSGLQNPLRKTSAKSMKKYHAKNLGSSGMREPKSPLS